MSSGGKGGEQKQSIELPDEIKDQAVKNMRLAEQVGKLPYAPYFGPSVAAFQPGQTAAFDNMNKAAGAFGLQGGAGAGMPAPNATAGGMSGYSTKPVYEQAMSQVPPEILKLFQAFFGPQSKGAGASPATIPPRAVAPAAGGFAPGRRWAWDRNGGVGGWT